MKPVQLRLSPHAVELIQAAAEAGKVRPWRVVELAILEALDGPRVAGSTHHAPIAALPPEALEIAQNAATFLEGQEDRPAAVKALQRAWRQALVLARQDLKSRVGLEGVFPASGSESETEGERYLL